MLYHLFKYYYIINIILLYHHVNDPAVIPGLSKSFFRCHVCVEGEMLDAAPQAYRRGLVAQWSGPWLRPNILTSF